jgi:arylsulfatase A-like enzyme
MAGMIETMDTAIGMLLDGVEELGLKDNTIIVFLSDNGGFSSKPPGRDPTPPTSNSPLRGGKGQLYEGGVRVPLILRWPGVIEAGVVRDQTFDGISIVPVLHGRPLPRNTVFTHFPHYMPSGIPST